MTQVEAEAAPRRPRGRPRLREDAETIGIIVSAASEEFMARGFEAANMASLAQRAGLSTKTLYRLIPTKEELFRRVVAARIEAFDLSIDLTALSKLSQEEALVELLVNYGELALSQDAMAMYRLAIAEFGRFPELAAVFQKTAIEPGGRVVEAWLRLQHERGLIDVSDFAQTSGILRGMMAMEGQRAALLSAQPPPDRSALLARAKVCAKLFLNGCTVSGPPRRMEGGAG